MLLVSCTETHMNNDLISELIMAAAKMKLKVMSELIMSPKMYVLIVSSKVFVLIVSSMMFVTQATLSRTQQKVGN